MDTDETKISLLENYIFKKKAKYRVKLQNNGKKERKDRRQEDMFRRPCRCISDGKHEQMKDRKKINEY